MTPATEERILRLAQVMCDGTATTEDRDELETLLRGNADAQAVYLSYLDLHSELRWRYRADEATDAVPEEISVPEATPLWSRLYRLPARWRELPLKSKSLLIAAATMACVVVALALWGIPAKGPTVARITRSHNCAWVWPAFEEGEQVYELAAGELIELERGLAEVRFENGAVVLLSGPCEFRMESERGGRLSRGKLSARHTGGGLVIATPSATVTDLGTEFAVRVPRDGSTEVHVFSGAVEVAEGLSVHRLGEGEAIKVDQQNPHPMPASDREFVRDFPPPRSDFSSGTEGWKATFDGTPPKFYARGGLAGGYIEVVDTTQGGIYYFHFQAPSKFLGDQSAAFGQELSFALKPHREPNQKLGKPQWMLLHGADFSIGVRVEVRQDALDEWSTYRIPLDESGGWRRMDYSARPRASSEEIKRVLADLRGLEIPGEFFGDHGDLSGLDEVSLGR